MRHAQSGPDRSRRPVHRTIHGWRSGGPRAIWAPLSWLQRVILVVSRQAPAYRSPDAMHWTPAQAELERIATPAEIHSICRWCGNTIGQGDFPVLGLCAACVNAGRTVGFEIDGRIWRIDDVPLDSDEFWDAFLCFIEDKGWMFAGRVSLTYIDGDGLMRQDDAIDEQVYLNAARAALGVWPDFDSPTLRDRAQHDWHRRTVESAYRDGQASKGARR